eukprot:10796105-Alexandrium_andersonii.AAC.1
MCIRDRCAATSETVPSSTSGAPTSAARSRRSLVELHLLAQLDRPERVHAARDDRRVPAERFPQGRHAR